MAGKNEKVDFLSEIGSMVKSQKEENQILRRKKAENRIDEPELSVEVEKKTNNLWLHRKRTER